MKEENYMFKNHRTNLMKELKNHNFQFAILANPSNLLYYSGFTGGEGFLLISVKDEKSYMITDSRYYEQVEKECNDVSLIPIEEKGLLLSIQDIFNRSVQGEFFHVALEETFSLVHYLKLKDCCHAQFHIEGNLLSKSRMIKDEDEIVKIEKAEKIGDEAFSHILALLKPGMSESDIALELEFFMKKQGASKLSFDTIVASGEHSSMPHAQITNRRLQLGDFVTMDFGCIYKGYCSDMTRTVAIGNPSDDMKKVYQIVLNANTMAIQKVHVGKMCNEIDSIARNYIKEHGYGAYFGHGLGHGVGLDIHEEPRFSPKCNESLKENMVITVEPGIYLPGRFGVRIEDLIVVKKNGPLNLSHTTKELIII